MDFLACEFSDVFRIQMCTVVATAETSENPGTLEVEQQAAKGLKRVAGKAVLHCLPTVISPCSLSDSCIALGSIVLFAVGLVAQYVINLVYHMGCHLREDLRGGREAQRMVLG